jgi:hypothetical protein
VIGREAVRGKSPRFPCQSLGPKRASCIVCMVRRQAAARSVLPTFGLSFPEELLCCFSLRRTSLSLCCSLCWLLSGSKPEHARDARFGQRSLTQNSRVHLHLRVSIVHANLFVSSRRALKQTVGNLYVCLIADHHLPASAERQPERHHSRPADRAAQGTARTFLPESIFPA